MFPFWDFLLTGMQEGKNGANRGQILETFHRHWWWGSRSFVFGVLYMTFERDGFVLSMAMYLRDKWRWVWRFWSSVAGPSECCDTDRIWGWNFELPGFLFSSLLPFPYSISSFLSILHSFSTPSLPCQLIDWFSTLPSPNCLVLEFVHTCR